MTTKLRISDDLALPLDAVTQRFAFLGRVGSGKTYGSTKLAELMLEAHAQIVVLDPVGLWYGLRVPGAGAAFKVPLFGGLHGDAPLTPSSGALFADLVVDRGISAIFDVSQFEADAEKARFAKDFATRFFFRKKAAPSAVHIFVEEAQEFVPQNPQGGEELMLHAFTRLAKLGRNFGIGLSLISQRPQEISKKVLNLTECLLAFQMTGKHERDSIQAWATSRGVDEQKLRDVLPFLKIGEPHVWSPGWLEIGRVIRIAEKRTANVSATPTVGEHREVRELTPVDIEGIRAALAETIEKAKEEDPAELRKEIAELKKKLASKPLPTPPPPLLSGEQWDALKTAYVRVTELNATVRGYTTELVSLSESILLGANARGADVKTIYARQDNTPSAQGPTPLRQSEALQPRPATPKEKSERHRAQTAPVADIADGLRRMLIALAQRPRGLTNKQLGVRAGLAISGTFSGYLAGARRAGWIEDAGPIRMITLAGREAIGDYDPLPTGAALADYWVGKLEDGAARMLRALIKAHPKALTNAELAEEAGLAVSGTFSGYLAHLRKLELATKAPTRASDELFEGGA